MPDYQGCEELNDHRLGKLLELDLDEVILSSGWRDDELAELPAIINLIRSKTDANIVLFGRRARFGRSVPLLLEENASIANFDEVALRSVERFVEANAELSRLAASLNVEFIDIAKLQCPESCQVLADGRLYYLDVHHLTSEGAAYLAQALKEEYPEIASRWTRNR